VTISLDTGGSERQMLTLARKLPKGEFAVSFILLAREGTGGVVARSSSAKVHVVGFRRMSRSPSAKTARMLLSNIRSVVRFLGLVHSGRYDVLDGWLYPGYFLAALTRPISRVPVVISGRRSLSDYKERWGILLRLMDMVATRWSDTVVANSNEVARDVAQREKIHLPAIRVIRNGVDVPTTPDLDARAELRARWGVSDENFLVGCIANYKSGKGLERLIAAAAIVCREHPMLRFVVVGEGPLRKALTELIDLNGLDGRVTLHGAEADARRILPALDAFVQSSDSEGLPNVVLEAAAAGLPIVATDAGGTREIVVDGETGLLVPVGDSERLAQAITRLVTNADERLAMGMRARDRTLREFSVDRLVSDWASLYNELAAKKGLAL
jgi:glycosyltransferase involved in cell wall biosynthesis